MEQVPFHVFVWVFTYKNNVVVAIKIGIFVEVGALLSRFYSISTCCYLPLLVYFDNLSLISQL